MGGRWEEGYGLLQQSLVNEEQDMDTYQTVHKEMPNLTDFKNNHKFIRYRFAHEFLATQQIAGEQERRQAVQEVYERICGIMNGHYHLL